MPGSRVLCGLGWEHSSVDMKVNSVDIVSGM